MVTYLLLNLVFILVIGAAFRLDEQRFTKRTALMIGVLFALTAIFDSVLVGLHIVGYDADHILGIALGLAPLEDYFYPLLAILLVPVLWKRFGGNDDGDD